MSIGRFAQQAKQCLEKQAEFAKLNAFVPSTSNYESILRCCLEADDREANGNRLSPIDGQLIAIKDNICTLGQPTTCASAILQGYQSPFSAKVVEKLKAAGAVIAGKTNLDEFGMGSHSINSIHGSIKSAWSEPERERTVGGSSGGSALAVGTEQCYAALGTDTGGSVRLPAAWTGTVGFKPSYGMVSRWGVVAYANSLDTVGIIARNINAAKQVYDQIRGHDPRDPTSLPPPSLTRIRSHIHSRPPTRPLRIGIPLEYLVRELHPTTRIAWSLTLQSLRQKGHSIHHISLPTTKSALSAYYVIAPAEASSNLAKYDGVRYGRKISSPRSSSATTADKIERQKTNPLFSPTRGALFGPEVRRRILLGSYTLSSTAMDNYFIRAQKVRRLVQDDFNRVFALPHPLLPPPPHLPPRLADSDAAAASSESKSVEVDVIVTPTSLRPPPLLSELKTEKEGDPTREFYEDLYTVPASLAGLPAVSVPVKVAGEGKGGKGETKVGLQVIGQFGDDELVLQVGREIES